MYIPKLPQSVALDDRLVTWDHCGDCLYTSKAFPWGAGRPVDDRFMISNHCEAGLHASKSLIQLSKNFLESLGYSVDGLYASNNFPWGVV